MGASAPSYDPAAVEALLAQCDFIGISAYAPLNGADFPTTALQVCRRRLRRRRRASRSLRDPTRDTRSFPPQNSAFNVMDSLKGAGLALEAILRRTGAELHYVEFGVGGGVSQAGATPSTSPDEVRACQGVQLNAGHRPEPILQPGPDNPRAQASNKPFWGVQGAYAASLDPWRTPRMAEFRRAFYDKALQWLAQVRAILARGRASPFTQGPLTERILLQPLRVQGGGPTYGVSAAFVWCKASWDVLGVYPESTTAEGSYADARVVQAVAAHNARATTAGGGA